MSQWFTSPYYWGYNIQQIFEGDIQNPQKGTFTNPCLTQVIAALDVHGYYTCPQQKNQHHHHTDVLVRLNDTRDVEAFVQDLTLQMLEPRYAAIIHLYLQHVTCHQH